MPEKVNYAGLDALFDDARARMPALISELMPHADAKLLDRIKRWRQMPDGKARSREFRHILSALLMAQARSPEEKAKRKEAAARRRRGDYELAPVDGGGMMISCQDYDHIVKVLRLEWDRGPDDDLSPTPEQLTMAYVARMAEAKTPRRRELITKAYEAFRRYLGTCLTAALN